MKAFASYCDYMARYGEADDPAAVKTLLADAAAYIVSRPGFRLRPSDEVQAANLVRVSCSIVNRMVGREGFAGIESYTQGAGDYSVTLSPYNPAGDMYLTGEEKLALGIGRGKVGQTWPAPRRMAVRGDGDDGGDDGEEGEADEGGP